MALNAHRHTVPHGKQASLLMPTIEQLMRDAGIGYTDLDCMVTTVGPGSFTGLRIALATLHGLALASHVPIKTITATEAVAWDIEESHFIVALNAGKGEAFLQEFRMTHGKPQAQGSITLHPQQIIHDLALPCYSNLWQTDHDEYVPGPDAVVLARIAPHLPTGSLTEAMPYYIREADAKIPQKPHWLS